MNVEMQNIAALQEIALQNLVVLSEMGREKEVREGIVALHPADIAELINALGEPDVKTKVFSFLAPEMAPQVLSLMSPSARQEVIRSLPESHLQQILEKLASDDAADLLGALPKERVPALLDRLSSLQAARIQQLLRYPADTAGGLMQTEYAAVVAGATLEEAVEIVRSLAEKMPDIRDVFVVDDHFHLLGVLPLTRLILARAEQMVEAVMDRQVISVTVDVGQEEVARLFKKYDLVSMPVTDSHGALLGRITIDDVMDVMEEEASEDLYKIAGVRHSNVERINLVSDPVLKRVRLRFSWIIITLTFELLVALVIGKFFVNTVEKLAILTAFIPVIIAIAGNVGLQSSTLVVRSIALGTISLSKTLRIVFSETRTGFLLGLICGMITGTVGFLLNMTNPEVTHLVVSVFVGMASALTAAATIGTVEPLILHKLKQDPAVSSGPMITAVNDLMGTTMYLLVATLLQR
jgi:magnesium transporter